MDSALQEQTPLSFVRFFRCRQPNELPVFVEPVGIGPVHLGDQTFLESQKSFRVRL